MYVQGKKGRLFATLKCQTSFGNTDMVQYWYGKLSRSHGTAMVQYWYVILIWFAQFCLFLLFFISNPFQTFPKPTQNYTTYLYTLNLVGTMFYYMQGFIVCRLKFDVVLPMAKRTDIFLKTHLMLGINIFRVLTSQRQVRDKDSITQ